MSTYPALFLQQVPYLPDVIWRCRLDFHYVAHDNGIVITFALNKQGCQWHQHVSILILKPDIKLSIRTFNSGRPETFIDPFPARLGGICCI